MGASNNGWIPPDPLRSIAQRHGGLSHAECPRAGRQKQIERPFVGASGLCDRHRRGAESDDNSCGDESRELRPASPHR